MFVIEFDSADQIQMVMLNGPCLFDRRLIAIRVLQKGGCLSKLVFIHVDFWVHIVDLLFIGSHSR